jgi:hypothetical protein
MPPTVPTYLDLPPVHLRTASQLRADGLQPRPGASPAGWLRKTFEGDVWRTELYTDAGAMPLPLTGRRSAGRREMTIVHWHRRPRRGPDVLPPGGDRRSKVHVSLTGARTACGAYIPVDATVVAVTADWHLHTDCYNCASKLWVHYAPEGYQRPVNGSDFPMRRSGQPLGRIAGRPANPPPGQEVLFRLEPNRPGRDDQGRQAA